MVRIIRVWVIVIIYGYIRIRARYEGQASGYKCVIFEAYDSHKLHDCCTFGGACDLTVRDTDSNCCLCSFLAVLLKFLLYLYMLLLSYKHINH